MARLTAAQFLLELVRHAGSPRVTRDPLADARRFIELHGATGEGQALHKVMTTLKTTEGKFSDAEIWSFSRETVGLVAALVQARIEGTYSEKDWKP